MKKHSKISTSRIFIAIVFLAATFLNTFQIEQASAAQISLRTLTLQNGATDGGSEPGGVVTHYFSFTLPGGSDVGSIQFKYCTLAYAPSITCVAPTGLNTTSATLLNETNVTGFTMVNTTNGEPYLTRAVANVAANQPATYQLGSITNPTTTNQTFFVWVSTFISTDATGAATDTGTVAASTATPIELSGTMPESLVFCTGRIVGTTSGVPDCSTASNGLVTFNQLFSPTATASATSQMAASTNAGQGYVIAVWGPTLTSGANTISSMAAVGASIKGIKQFGMNLKANTVAASDPAVGIEVLPASNATNWIGRASGDYASVDQFKFVSGNTVAASDDPAPGASDAQIFTVTYIVNVPGSQAAGTYTTTLTYICTPTF